VFNLQPGSGLGFIRSHGLSFGIGNIFGFIKSIKKVLELVSYIQKTINIESRI